MHRRDRLPLGVAVAVVTGTVVALAPVGPVAAVDNPPIADTCGVDVTLVLDASGSIQSSDAVDDVRDAAQAFLDALRNTNSTARVTQFATVSEQLAPSTIIDDGSLGPGGALDLALRDYYSPKPPRPPGVAFKQYRGGNPQSASSWRDGSSDQYTNWDQALDEANDVASELVVLVTDGDPTAYDFDAPGDPFDAGPPPDVGYQTNSGAAEQVTLDRAVAEADELKTTGARMLTVGVGAALGSQASVDRLVAVTGPQVVRDDELDDVDSLNDVDVALVTDFEDLAQVLRSVVLQLCSPSLTIRKLAQSANRSAYLPAADWDVTVAPDTPNGQFDWILPDTVPAASKTLPTDENGFAQFQWEPDPPEQDSSATVTEAVQPEFEPGRPDADDFRCELRDEDGGVRTVEGDLAVNGTTASFAIPGIGQEVVTCTIWNSFDFQPAIAITKVNDPAVVRGDLAPPPTVTSSYEVTNQGNTPLSNVTVTDDRCGPVESVPVGGPNVGDADGDGRLDITETWRFTCTRNVGPARSPARSAAVTITNTVTVVGTDPSGTTVTDTATDDVEVYVPQIALTKLVDGEPAVTVVQGATVTYTYTATNTGNTPLGSVTLVDDSPPCEAPSPDDTNGPPPLGPGETWTYTCTATATTDVVNTATVTGVPLVPGEGAVPFPDPNPPVSATDVAEVDVINPNIELTKSAAPDVVLLGPDGTPEVVTYTFEATNTGTPALNRPGAVTAGPAKDPGWVADARCVDPASYVSGDDDGNDLLDPGETWVFTCTGLVDSPTLNIAAIVGQPADETGAPLPDTDPVSDLALAYVDVLRPAIAIEKLALRGVVLDPEAAAVAGPDVPTRRPAEYRYEVSNPGNVELAVDPATLVDDTCAPLTFVDGDGDGDGLVDVDETWVYTCEAPLGRDDANTPPVTGDESGLVQNEVTVAGVPVLGGTAFPDKSVSASDIAQVLVIEPGIELTKDVSAGVVLTGGEVTYSVTVANTGDVGLDVIGPTDDECAELVFAGGDGNGNGILDGANSGVQEQWTYTCTRAIGRPTEPDAVSEINTASVAGIDPLGNRYVADDTAEVRVFEPAIRLTKSVDESLVPVGTEVTYDFVVTNVGTSPVVADDVLDDVSLLDVSAPPLPTCARPVFVGGDDGDGLLQREPAEAWTYRCRAAIGAPTTNVAIVRGVGGAQFDLPVEVFDVDAAYVQTFSPAISITKAASPTQLLGGGPVTYTYTVRNTGDVPLADVAERIVDDRCAPVEYVSGDEDGDGLLDTVDSIFEDALDETWTFTCTATISETTANTVVVTGTPTDPAGKPLCGAGEVVVAQVAEPCDVAAEATATVTVIEPATLEVVKRTPRPTSATFEFTLGDETFTLARDGRRAVTGLAPGTYTVTERPATGWRLARLECTDPNDDSAVGVADREATIVLSAGETVTCTFTNRPVGELPATGPTTASRLVQTGAWLTLLGALLVLAVRRRRPASP